MVPRLGFSYYIKKPLSRNFGEKGWSQRGKNEIAVGPESPLGLLKGSFSGDTLPQVPLKRIGGETGQVRFCAGGCLC